MWSQWKRSEKFDTRSRHFERILKARLHICDIILSKNVFVFFWALVWLLLKTERASDSGDDNNQVEWNDRLEMLSGGLCGVLVRDVHHSNTKRMCLFPRTAGVGHQDGRYILQYNCNGRS